MAATTASASASEQLHATCIKALKEEHKIQFQLEALHLRIKKLRRHGRDLDLRAEAGQNATEDAVQTYAKDLCLNICTKVHQTFPREIRDMIYGYITDCEELTVSELPPRPYSRKDVRRSYFSQTARPKLGTISRNQTLTTGGWQNSFQFKNSLEVIPKFRITDQWKLDFLPVSFVSIVEVVITCDGHNFQAYKENPWHEVPEQPGSMWDTVADDEWDTRRPILSGKLADIPTPELLV
ncbi:hypothetical protein BKA58DRAFT_433331 [Alternaria rosae]|uniref:uncharacterized protein n=1 Tax=Alternaria rosae TaxID=1187941 RepID=UPI001E8DEF8E|nr:uncharacterized protein BKA58DRAFT_433331 [Alternaria rosae]KAH6881546.1 hypothetical protein BKA58DRAFT_433331 [Alternaria rosae]